MTMRERMNTNEEKDLYEQAPKQTTMHICTRRYVRVQKIKVLNSHICFLHIVPEFTFGLLDSHLSIPCLICVLGALLIYVIKRLRCRTCFVSQAFLFLQLQFNISVRYGILNIRIGIYKKFE